MSRISLTLLALIFLTSICAAVEVPKVYYLGDCLPSTSPIGYIGDDPAIDVIAVPATVHSGYFTQDEANRALRLYLPRTYDQLLDGELILLSDVRADTLPAKWLSWFSQSVESGGLGLMMIGGILSFGGYADSPSWDITSIGPILPVSLLASETHSIAWRPVVRAPSDPLMTALPWGTCPPFGGYNKVGLKEGAKLLAETDDGAANPFMAFWRLGSGSSFAFTTDWTPGWGVDFMEWEFYADFTVYSVYYASGRDVPQDLELMHLIRMDLVGYKTEKDVLIALINFVEKVGANVVKIEEMVKIADDMRAKADDDYILQDYQACAEALEQARDELKGIEDETMKVKARAFFWIWIIEWLAVTATMMVTGFVLWTVMVRRRLYREVKSTRATSQIQDLC